MVVLLFDVDGTLVQTGGAGGAALLGAFSDLFAVEEPASVPLSGRTDRGIVGNLFRHHGVTDTAENWHQLYQEYLRRLRTLLPQREGFICPGIVPLLEQLAERKDVAMGLLTGNVRQGARLKLEHFGLFHHFKFGGYGDHFPDRDDVAGEAFADVCRYLDQDVSPDSVWVIGDTPLDVQCARAIDAHAAAVATGWHSRQELADAGPDLLLDDFNQPRPFLDRLGLAPVE